MMMSKNAIWLAGLLSLSIAHPAAAETTKRPLSDFLDQQGSNSSFFVPFPDYVGFTDGAFETFCLVDYAGVTGAFLADSFAVELGTNVRGQVFEEAMPDGSAEITVILHTKNALGFAQNIEDIINNGFDFSSTPTIFGNKALDVAVGDPAAVGSTSLKTRFRIAAPGDPLPDFIDVVFSTDYDPAEFDARATIFDGERTMMKVQQTAGGVRDEGDVLLSQQEVCEIRGRNH